MRRYFFQLKYYEKSWDETPATKKEFLTKSLAIEWAKYLSMVNGGIECRMTDNDKLLNGTYYKAPAWTPKTITL